MRHDVRCVLLYMYIASVHANVMDIGRHLNANYYYGTHWLYARYTPTNDARRPFCVTSCSLWLWHIKMNVRVCIRFWANVFLPNGRDASMGWTFVDLQCEMFGEMCYVMRTKEPRNPRRLPIRSYPFCITHPFVMYCIDGIQRSVDSTTSSVTTCVD